MLSADLTLIDPVTTIGSGSLGYYVIYQGYDDRALRQKLAQIYWKSSPALRFEAPHLAALPDHGSGASTEFCDSSLKKRLRVGFISKFFFHHSVGLLTQGVICGIDRSLFNVTTFFIQPQPVDEVSKHLMSCSDQAIDAGTSLSSAQMVVSSQELDVLVFTEIGMDAVTYFLAFSHLAKRTVFFWGHAITSGISVSDSMLAGLDPTKAGGIDYFVSSLLFETLGELAQKKYTERLYLMDGLTTSFARPMEPRPGMTLEDFELQAGLNIYLVPQTLYKLHPDFDGVLRNVLEQDPKGVVVMPEAQLSDWTATLLERMQNSLGPYLERIKIIRRMDFDEFQAMAALANVVIDPFPLGGGRSSLEILSTGTPIVAWYNRTSILQLTFGMYKIMGMEDCCIAYDELDFVQKIVTIGSNRQVEHALRKKILERNHLLYERQDVVEEWEDFLQYIMCVPRPLNTATEKMAITARDLTKPRQEPKALSLPPISILLETEFQLQKPDPNWRWVSRNEFGWEAVAEEDVSLNERLFPKVIPDSMHPDLLYAIRLVFPNPYTEMTTNYILEVWRHQTPAEVALEFAKHAALDFSQLRWVHRILERGVNIQLEPVIWKQSVLLHNPNGDVCRNFSICIHDGEDINQAVIFLAYQHQLDDRFIEFAVELVQSSINTTSPQWLKSRASLINIQSSPPELQKKWPGEEIPRTYPFATSGDCITLGITTSKRLSLFTASIFHLESAVGPLPNSLICQVIIVDDGSSPLDRTQMLEHFPKYEFLFKAPMERGHANSLNKLMSLVKSRYFMYMEDDWQYLIKDNSTIINALHVLQKSSTTAEPLVQVIFNDQSCRSLKYPTDYAAPDQRCHHRSGWPRQLDGLSYMLHEFGVLHPHHDIAYWPGFSLNPALWDLSLLHDSFAEKGLTVHFNETDRLFESWFSMQVADLGLLVAHLDGISFRHIGTQESAYTLNNLKRPWDYL